MMTKKQPWEDAGEGDEGQPNPSLSDDPAELKTTIADLQKKIRSLEGSVNGSRGYTEQLKGELESLKTTNAQLATEYEGQLTEWKTKHDQLATTFANLESELKTAKTELSKREAREKAQGFVKKFAEDNKVPKLNDFIDELIPALGAFEDEAAQAAYLNSFAQKLVGNTQLERQDPLSGATPPPPSFGSQGGRDIKAIERDIAAQIDTGSQKYRDLVNEHMEALDRLGIK